MRPPLSIETHHHLRGRSGRVVGNSASGESRRDVGGARAAKWARAPSLVWSLSSPSSLLITLQMWALHCTVLAGQSHHHHTARPAALVWSDLA